MDIAGNVERHHLNLLMQSQYWPREKLMGYQQHFLGHLLMHTYNKVPFYKSRLGKIFNPDGSIHWNRWYDIPTLKRQDLVEHYESMKASSIPPEMGITAEFTSSGTTGIPVTTLHNGMASWANRAAVIRSYYWHQTNWDKNLCELPLQNNPDPARMEDAKLVGTWGPAGVHTHGQFWHFDRAASLEAQLEFLQHKNIAYLASRPKAAQMLAHAALRLGVKHKIDAVLSVGTAVGIDDRQACMEAFGAKIVGMYSSKEGYKMAYQCPTGNHYHAMSEMSLLEILDDNNRPCRPGETGRVVITPFFSYAQPLIRYEQGDLAEAGEPCACGRTLPVINHISGRVMHLFRFPDGSKIAPVLPDYAREAFGHITWQMAQTKPLTIELRYICDREIDAPGQDYIATAVKRTMYKDVEVVFKKLDSIPLNDNGKFLEYVCELPAGDMA